MNIQLRNMLKVVMISDIVIAVVTAIACYIFFKPYVFVTVIGITIAAVNFLLNVVTTNFIFMLNRKKIISMLVTVLRIIITIVIAIIICNDDKNKYIAILLGYTFHYVSIIIYGITANKDN